MKTRSPRTILTSATPKNRKNLDRLQNEVSVPCFHGGSFFPAIGTRFQTLDRKDDIINADVLDAWFPPAPGVIDSLTKDLPWLLRTSPPTHCEGLVQTIARARGVDSRNILPGAGSSDLIFRAFREWLTKDSRVLILDPTYGEYIHVLENIIGCQVSRLKLDQNSHYDLDPGILQKELSSNYDLIVLVNPNSPTGRHIPAEKLQAILRTAPPSTRIWIDETYIDYLSKSESLEQFAADRENVIVCKSMSKVYALSGARAAYLCAAPHHLKSLRAITPPWVIGIPSQLAAVRALEDPHYYQIRYQQTHHLRNELAAGLKQLAWHPIPGVANFILCQLPHHGPSPHEIITKCQRMNLFLRDPGSMGSPSLQRLIRIAVKDAPTNARMLEILASVIPRTASLKNINQ
ncbi:histidinol-phosphate transaminase [Verrucomicrobiaceae bacterium 227]